ncbi:MAG: hypothetical protein EOO29_08380 [Comamonadaceae bacterium]|nr:MAG: hypothetical protein EOO29_08380 [Comamonadaceae bacterium]
MDALVWQDVNVAAQTDADAAVAITGITKGADTTVQSATLPQNGDVVALRVVGIGGLDWAVGRVSDAAAGSFKLVGVESTDLKGTFRSGSYRVIELGAQAESLQEITPSGGDTQDIVIDTIHPKPAYSKPGKPSPLVYTFGSLWIPSDPVLKAFQSAGKAGRVLVVQFQWPDDTEMLFAGYPSAPMAPGGASGQAVTTPAKVSVRGPLVTYPGADA